MISKSGKSRKSNSRRSLGVIGCHPGCWDAYHKARAAGTSSRQIRPIPWRQPGCFIPTILQQRSFERDQGARAGENYGNLADANAWRRSELACAGRTSVDRTCLTGLTHEAPETQVRVTLTRQHQLCRRKSVQALPPQVFPRAPDLRRILLVDGIPVYCTIALWRRSNLRLALREAAALGGTYSAQFSSPIAASRSSGRGTWPRQVRTGTPTSNSNLMFGRCR